MDIQTFQQLMKTLYFHSDTKRGLARTTLWLVEEIGELAHELKKSESDLSRNAVEEEMADVMAWLCSIGNLLNIDLNTAVQKKYPGFCLKCGKSPCICNK